MSTEADKAILDISKEPVKYVRFRYIKEINDKKGYLRVEKPATGGPQLTMTIPRKYENNKFVVFTTLYNEATSSSSSSSSVSNVKFSPHILVKRKANEGDIDAERIYDNVLVDAMKRNPNNCLELHFSLEKCFVVCVTEAEINNAIERKCIAFTKWETQMAQPPDAQINETFRKYGQKFKSPKQKEFQKVCLGFTIYRQNPENKMQYEHFAGPKLSRPIHNKKPLLIEYVLNREVQVVGGEEVALLLNRMVEKSTVQLHLFEFGVNEKENVRVWQRVIDGEQLTILKCLVIFKAPAYDGENRGPKINCYITVKSGDNDDETPAKTITYNKFSICKRCHQEIAVDADENDSPARKESKRGIAK